MEPNLQKSRVRVRTIGRYAASGVAFGLCFPIVALTADALFLRPEPLDLVELVRTNPIHLIICMAPFVLGMVFLLLGISRAKLKEKNEMLKSALQLAQAGETAKHEFLAVISHEIRTPMNGILGMAELLTHTNLDEVQSEYVEAVRMSGEALLRIISNVLDSSQIETGNLVLHQEPFELGTLVHCVVQALKPDSDRKALDLEVDVAPDLPPVLSGDAERLAQVTRHLLCNAVKFTDAGRVSVRFSQDNRDGGVVQLRVEVSDTGRGMKADELGLIFDKFRQLDGSFSRVHEGAGLGLWISRALVVRMGGKIGVASRPGRGSTFWFTVPLVVPPAAARTRRIAS